jgi:hypothetical protein
VDIDQARELIDQLDREINEGQRVAAEALTRAEGALKAREGILAMFPKLLSPPDGADDPADDRPRGQDAVRRIMEDAPGKWWTVTGLLAELHAREWMPESDSPANAVRVAVERVVTGDPDRFYKAKGEKTGATTYSFRPFAKHADLIDQMAADTYERAGIGGVRRRVARPVEGAPG